jgi:initiation factor 1A
MVVNKKGGNRGKKVARKNINRGARQFNGKLRKSECYEEIYASVTKILGNGRVEIICNDGVIRHCVIRKNFRGKGKRDNEVHKGTLILAGMRDWATKNPEKTEVCDLLYVYDNGQVNMLKMDPEINMVMLLSVDESKAATKKISNPIEDIDFFDAGGASEDESIEENSEDNEPNAETIVNINADDNEEIDVDDI